MNKLVTLSMLFFMMSCTTETAENVEGDWIKGNEQDQLTAIERQFRGFDMAMVETGYRYQELYWAGEDENWEYANYQLEKIEKAIKNGLERRPKRAQSAQHFLNVVIPEVKKSVKTGDKALFDTNFQVLTTNCNSCHAMEKVPFFNIEAPATRNSPIRY